MTSSIEQTRIWTDSIKTKSLAVWNSLFVVIWMTWKRYWWLSLDLTYKSAVIFSPIREIVTSKKLTDVWDHFAVNFIIKCFSFKCSKRSLSFPSPCFQRKKMSSMYLHCYDFSSIPLKIPSSNSAIKNILYGRANFVLIAVSCFSSASVEVVTSFSCLKSSNLRRGKRPWSCGVLGYKSTTSIVHKIISSS